MSPGLLWRTAGTWAGLACPHLPETALGPSGYTPAHILTDIFTYTCSPHTHQHIQSHSHAHSHQYTHQIHTLTQIYTLSKTYESTTNSQSHICSVTHTFTHSHTCSNSTLMNTRPFTHALTHIHTFTDIHMCRKSSFKPALHTQSLLSVLECSSQLNPRTISRAWPLTPYKASAVTPSPIFWSFQRKEILPPATTSPLKNPAAQFSRDRVLT